MMGGVLWVGGNRGNIKREAGDYIVECSVGELPVATE